MFRDICKGIAISAGALYLIRQIAVYRWPTFNKKLDCRNFIVVITGGASGIGLATVEQLLSRGATVVLACRNTGKAKLQAEHLREVYHKAKIFVFEVDLADLKSVDSFCRKCEKHLPKIDVLILNAVASPGSYEKTKQGIELAMGTNHFGHARLTLGLLNLLKKSLQPRVIQLTSCGFKKYKSNFLQQRIQAITDAAQINDLCHSEVDYDSKNALLDSKLAGMLFMKALSRRYWFMKCFSVAPGVVASKVCDGRGQVRNRIAFSTRQILKGLALLFVTLRTPTQGSQTVLYAALDTGIGANHGFYADCQRQEGSELLNDDLICDKLFNATQVILNQCAQ